MCSYFKLENKNWGAIGAKNLTWDPLVSGSSTQQWPLKHWPVTRFNKPEQCFCFIGRLFVLLQKLLSYNNGRDVLHYFLIRPLY